MNEPGAGAGRAGGILAAGLWWNTPGLAVLIGLCPLLAASRTLAGGLALGIASLAVLCSSSAIAAVLGRRIPPRLRTAAFLIVIVALVTAVDLLFQARWLHLHGEVGLFVPLIVTNCVILARTEDFAAHHGLWPALLDAVGYGAGFTLVLGGLGALREVFAPGLLVAGLAPGALFLLALLVALRQAWLARQGRAP